MPHSETFPEADLNFIDFNDLLNLIAGQRSAFESVFTQGRFLWAGAVDQCVVVSLLHKQPYPAK